MARPSKFTADTRERILKALRAGNTRRAAAAFARIGESTLLLWLAQGREARDETDRIEAEIDAIRTERCTRRNQRRIAAAEERLAEIAPQAGFVDDVIFAEGEAEAAYVASLAHAAQGGQLVKKKTTTKERLNRYGNVISRESVTEDVRSPGDFRAAAFWLERRRKEFGRNLVLTGEDGGPVQHVLSYEIIPPAGVPDDGIGLATDCLATSQGGGEPPILD